MAVSAVPKQTLEIMASLLVSVLLYSLYYFLVFSAKDAKILSLDFWVEENQNFFLKTYYFAYFTYLHTLHSLHFGIFITYLA